MIKHGQILIVSSGAYSDYGVHGVYRALTTFDEKEVLNDYLETWPEQAEDYGFDASLYLTWLCDMRLLEQREVTEYYLGEYSCHQQVHLLNNRETEEAL